MGAGVPWRADMIARRYQGHHVITAWENGSRHACSLSSVPHPYYKCIIYWTQSGKGEVCMVWFHGSPFPHVHTSTAYMIIETALAICMQVQVASTHTQLAITCFECLLQYSANSRAFTPGIPIEHNFFMVTECDKTTAFTFEWCRIPLSATIERPKIMVFKRLGAFVKLNHGYMKLNIWQFMWNKNQTLDLPYAYNVPVSFLRSHGIIWIIPALCP